MTGVARWSIHTASASCFLHLSLSFPALMTFACCCLRRKIPLITFLRATEACGIAPYIFFFFCCDSICPKFFRGHGDGSVTSESKQSPGPRHSDLPLTYDGGGFKPSWAPDGPRSCVVLGKHTCLKGFCAHTVPGACGALRESEGVGLSRQVPYSLCGKNNARYSRNRHV